MDLLLILAFFILTAIINASQKKKQAAGKAAEQARKKNGTVPDSPETGGAGAEPAYSETIFPTPEGECAPDHVHTAQTEERHALKPSYETGHAHTETSTTGFDDMCPGPEGAGSVHQGEDSMNQINPKRAEAVPCAAGAARTAPSHLEASPSRAPAAACTPASPIAGMDTDKMREALVLGEILAKPKALRPKVRI